MIKKCGQQHKSRINTMKKDNEESINILDNVNLELLSSYCVILTEILTIAGGKKSLSDWTTSKNNKNAEIGRYIERRAYNRTYSSAKPVQRLAAVV